MGVRTPPPLPLRARSRGDGDRDADQGVCAGGPCGVPQGHLAEPSGAHQLHDHRDRGDGGARVFPWRCRYRAVQGGGKDSSMSGEAMPTADGNGANRQWFVVHTYSGFENKVAEAIQSRAKIFGMGEKITRVLVPTGKVVEVRNKQKRETDQKFFPGYVLVEMELTDDTWHLVRSTPKVTGFVGSGNKPVALSPDQVDDIQRQMEAGARETKPKSEIQRGDNVRVIDGPYVNFQGMVENINPERAGLKGSGPGVGA